MMSTINKLRERYAQNRWIRAVVQFLPHGSTSIDTILLPEQALKYFTSIDKTFFKKQKKCNIETILGASIGDWPLIVQDQDLKRDIQDEIVSALMQSEDQPSLLIILGDPGAGKTTLLRRIGKEVASSGRRVYELSPGAQSTSAWFGYLKELPRDKGMPFVLIDNIFRYEGIESILQDPDLDCVIVATSCVNEDNTKRIRETNALRLLKLQNAGNEETGWPILENPSVREFSELRKKPEFAHIEDKQWQAITTMRIGQNNVPSPMLAVMLQLSADGKPFDEIICEAMDKLRIEHPETFKAFCILCAFHRCGQLVPTPVFEVLLYQCPGFLAKLRFDVIKGKANCGAKGLIYLGDSFLYKECWQTAHELIAETASNSEFKVLIESHYDEIMERMDPANREHRAFASRFFRSLTSSSRKDMAAAYLVNTPKAIDNLVARDLQQQITWADAFDRLDDKARVLPCLRTANPMTPGGAMTLIRLLVKYHSIDEALNCATNWLAEHLDDTLVRTRYIGLVVQTGNSVQIEKVLSETSLWLEDHSDDTSVRTRYIGLVEKRGADVQVENVLSEISLWLAEHLDDTFVRTRYIGLVARKGVPEQVKKVLSETSLWLEGHSDDTSVRTRYIDLVEKKGTDEQVEKVLSETSSWLDNHSGDTSVRTRYIGLVVQTDNSALIEKVLSETSLWLEDHSDDTSVRTRYIRLVEKKGTDEQVEKVLLETSSWIEDRCNSAVVLTVFNGFLRLIQKHEHGVRISDDCLRKLVKISFGTDSVSTLVAICTYFRKQEEYENARSILVELVESQKWLRNYGLFNEYGRLLLNFEDYQKAISQFEIALDIHKGNQMAHDGFAFALAGAAHVSKRQGDLATANRCLKKAESEFKSAIYWAVIQKMPSGMFHNHLGRFYIDQERFDQALDAFKAAIEEKPEHYSNHRGAAEALIGLERFKEARSHLDTAYKNVPENVSPTVSEEISNLIEQCIVKLKGL